jgi:hypothetical protein
VLYPKKNVTFALDFLKQSADMKKLYKSNKAGKLTAYSAMAGAFVAIGTDANALVVYNDIDDVTYTLGEGYGLDLDDNGYPDFLMQGIATTGGAWTFASAIGALSSSGYGNPSNMVVGYTGAVLPYASALNAGEVIDSASPFMSNTYNRVWLASIYSGSTYGQFGDAGDKYMGVMFDIDGELHYGWARLDVTLAPVTVTVKDYAYEDVAEAGIEAGATTGGAVGIVALNENQIAAYSYGSTINVIVKDVNAGVNTVNVFDIDGRVVYTASVSGNNMSINLDNVATGLYTVQLTGAENAVFTKKLYIQN